MIKPTHLRVEHLDEPLGLTVTAPRMSWRLPEGTRRQLAYRIRAGRWDSGRVESDESILIPYDGPELHSGERVEWTVKVWTDAGESEWAEPSWWEMGLLSPQDWVVDWIEPPEPEDWDGHSPHPVHYLRGVRHIDGPIERARLYVTAHGVYEFFINGVRVGDAELTPGFTSYHSRLQVQTYDVTDLLKPGENILGAILSGGWVKWAPIYRSMSLGLMAQLETRISDRSIQTGTGNDWIAGQGSIRHADLQLGQTSDLRLRTDTSVAEDSPQRQAPVRIGAAKLERLTGPSAPPVRRIEEIRPVSVTVLEDGKYVVDFGQNINGWVRIRNLGPQGKDVTLTHGELLKNGDVTLANVLSPQQSVPIQQDHVIASGDPDEYFEPRHSTKGFRYLSIKGAASEIDKEDVSAVVVHTDMRRTGWFECSDSRLNELHESVVWSFRGNACDIPTDCPTRERAGWTGDWQTFVPTAAFLYDVAGFSTKWLKDLAADQLGNGLVRHCAPESTPLETHIKHKLPPGCAGFGDAAVIVPWEIYLAYGDQDLLAAQWNSMTAWVEYAAKQAKRYRHSSRQSLRPTPAAHERYLWDTGFHWGEWNEPDTPVDYDGVQAYMQELSKADHGNVATAYLSRSAHILANVARIIGEPAAAARYSRLSNAAREAWQIEFLRSDGRISPHKQSHYVRALAFGLIPDDMKKLVAAHLVDLVRSENDHPDTGFLATAHLLPVLAECGYPDVAYDLVFQETPPSWLAMLSQGGTTIWEHWFGVGKCMNTNEIPGLGSLNHYSKGSVASFLHKYVAGIDVDENFPGYRRVRINPRPGGGLSWARASHESFYGKITVAWEVLDNVFQLAVSIPPASDAIITLPNGESADVGPGERILTCAMNR